MVHYCDRVHDHILTWGPLSQVPGLKKYPSREIGFRRRTDLRFEESKTEKAYSTRYSQAVTHPSTNRARRCLTSVIGRAGPSRAKTGPGRKSMMIEQVPANQGSYSRVVGLPNKQKYA